MKSVTRTILIVTALLCFAGVPAIASDGGWILWEFVFFDGLGEADLARLGFVDEWTALNGFDTAVACHAAAKLEKGFDKPVNNFSAEMPVRFKNVNRCFPVAFDPRTMASSRPKIEATEKVAANAKR